MADAGILVPLDEPLSVDDRERLGLFHAHFLEFWDNFDELRSSGLRSDWNMELLQDGSVEVSELGVHWHRLKGFLLDYRKFHQQTEPINFFRVCNIAKRRCYDPRLRLRIDTNKTSWSEPSLSVLGWHNEITIQDFVDALFNQELFHVGEGMGVQIGEIRKQLGPRAVQFCLFAIAYERLLALRNVHWIVKPSIDGEPAFRIPST